MPGICFSRSRTRYSSAYEPEQVEKDWEAEGKKKGTLFQAALDKLSGKKDPVYEVIVLRAGKTEGVGGLEPNYDELVKAKGLGGSPRTGSPSDGRRDKKTQRSPSLARPLLTPLPTPPPRRRRDSGRSGCSTPGPAPEDEGCQSRSLYSSPVRTALPTPPPRRRRDSGERSGCNSLQRSGRSPCVSPSPGGRVTSPSPSTGRSRTSPPDTSKPPVPPARSPHRLRKNKLGKSELARNALTPDSMSPAPLQISETNLDNSDHNSGYGDIGTDDNNNQDTLSQSEEVLRELSRSPRGQQYYGKIVLVEGKPASGQRREEERPLSAYSQLSSAMTLLCSLGGQSEGSASTSTLQCEDQGSELETECMKEDVESKILEMEQLIQTLEVEPLPNIVKKETATDESRDESEYQYIIREEKARSEELYKGTERVSQAPSLSFKFQSFQDCNMSLDPEPDQPLHERTKATKQESVRFSQGEDHLIESINISSLQKSEMDCFDEKTACAKFSKGTESESERIITDIESRSEATNLAMKPFSERVGLYLEPVRNSGDMDSVSERVSMALKWVSEGAIAMGSVSERVSLDVTAKISQGSESISERVSAVIEPVTERISAKPESPRIIMDAIAKINKEAEPLRVSPGSGRVSMESQCESVNKVMGRISMESSSAENTMELDLLSEALQIESMTDTLGGEVASETLGLVSEHESDSDLESLPEILESCRVQSVTSAQDIIEEEFTALDEKQVMNTKRVELSKEEGIKAECVDEYIEPGHESPDGGHPDTFTQSLDSGSIEIATDVRLNGGGQTHKNWGGGGGEGGEGSQQAAGEGRDQEQDHQLARVVSRQGSVERQELAAVSNARMEDRWAEARVQRSLERLDLPPWYTQRSPCSSPSSPTPPPYPSLGRGREGSVSSPSPSLRWREGCSSPLSSRWRDSSLPPPAPIRTPTPRSRPPPSPSSPPPYLGWRSQEKLPSFLPTQPRNRVGSVPRSQVQEYSL